LSPRVLDDDDGMGQQETRTRSSLSGQLLVILRSAHVRTTLLVALCASNCLTMLRHRASSPVVKPCFTGCSIVLYSHLCSACVRAARLYAALPTVAPRSTVPETLQCWPRYGIGASQPLAVKYNLLFRCVRRRHQAKTLSVRTT